MRFERLGPLRVCAANDESFALSAPKVETTLALLLISNGRIVSKARADYGQLSADPTG